MSSKSPTVIQRYTPTAMVLHWMIAILIIVNVALIWSVEWLPIYVARPVVDTHKSAGITVLGLVIMRLLWRSTHRPPALPASYPRWEQLAAHSAHFALYLLILALPLSGWMHDSAWKAAREMPMYLFGLVQWPRIGWIMNFDPAFKEQFHDVSGNVHIWLSYVLYAFFLLHVGAVLKHQWWDRQPELERMLSGTDGARR